MYILSLEGAAIIQLVGHTALILVNTLSTPCRHTVFLLDLMYPYFDNIRKRNTESFAFRYFQLLVDQSIGQSSSRVVGYY